MHNNTDKVVETNHLYQTDNYTQFKYLKGNRKLDMQHARSLARKMKNEGSLLQSFPILVNENLEVLDGQHRLKAAEICEYPVFYEVKSGLNIDSVTTLNTGTKNWNWRDFANRYAMFGNENYAMFIDLAKENEPMRFSILLTYASLGKSIQGNGRQSAYFSNGDFVMKNYELTKKLLKQFQEIAIITNLSGREFAYAVFKFMRTPSYNHTLMLDKIEKYGDGLNNCYITSDYLLELENIWRAK